MSRKYRQRFLSGKNTFSRIHAEVGIDFTAPIPKLTRIPPLGATVDTVRLRISTGEVLNAGRGIARGEFVPVSGFVTGSRTVTVRFNIAGKIRWPKRRGSV